MTYLRWKNTLNRMIIILPDYTHITTYYYKHLLHYNCYYYYYYFVMSSFFRRSGLTLNCELRREVYKVVKSRQRHKST